jgi:hypothetical protein
LISAATHCFESIGSLSFKRDHSLIFQGGIVASAATPSSVPKSSVTVCADPNLSNFCKAKDKERRARLPSASYQKHIKEVTMQYVILLSVISMMALYALIIVGCLKQPEW